MFFPIYLAYLDWITK